LANILVSLEQVGFSHKRRGFSHRNRVWVNGKRIIRTGWIPSTVRLRDGVANSHLSTVLRSFVKSEPIRGCMKTPT